MLNHPVYIYICIIPYHKYIFICLCAVRPQTMLCKEQINFANDMDEYINSNLHLVKSLFN